MATTKSSAGGAGRRKGERKAENKLLDVDKFRRTFSTGVTAKFYTVGSWKQGGGKFGKRG